MRRPSWAAAAVRSGSSWRRSAWMSLLQCNDVKQASEVDWEPTLLFAYKSDYIRLDNNYSTMYMESPVGGHVRPPPLYMHCYTVCIYTVPARNIYTRLS